MSNSTAEDDQQLVWSLFVDGEPALIEPAGDLRKVVVVKSEATPESLRREPMVKLRRTGSLLGLSETVESRLLRRGRFEDKDHLFHAGRIRNCAPIIFRIRRRMNIANGSCYAL